MPFVLENSTNFHICHDTTLFINYELFDTNMGSTIEAVGKVSKPEGTCDMCLEGKDDLGNDHRHIT